MEKGSECNFFRKKTVQDYYNLKVVTVYIYLIYLSGNLQRKKYFNLQVINKKRRSNIALAVELQDFGIVL